MLKTKEIPRHLFSFLKKDEQRFVCGEVWKKYVPHGGMPGETTLMPLIYKDGAYTAGLYSGNPQTGTRSSIETFLLYGSPDPVSAKTQTFVMRIDGGQLDRYGKYLPNVAVRNWTELVKLDKNLLELMAIVHDELKRVADKNHIPIVPLTFGRETVAKNEGSSPTGRGSTPIISSNFY